MSVIDRTVPCVGCGYNLRGVDAAGTCPECGRPAADSLSPNRLALADPAWLGRVVRGLDTIALGLVFGAAMFVVLVVVTGVWYLQPPWAEFVAWALGLPPGVVVWWGCRQVTARSPGSVSGASGASGASEIEDASDLARLLARHAADVILLLAVFTGPLWLLHEGLGLLTFGLGGVAAVVGGFAALIYARQLAERIPAPKLRSGTVTAIAGYLGTCGAAGVTLAFAAVAFYIEYTAQSHGSRANNELLENLGIVMLILSVLAGGAHRVRRDDDARLDRNPPALVPHRPRPRPPTGHP